MLQHLRKHLRLDLGYAIKGGSWLMLGNASSSLLLFGLSIAYANILDKEAFGHFRYIQSIAAILVACTLTGMNTAVTQAVSRGYEGTFRASILPQLRWALLYVAAACGFGLYYFFSGNTDTAISLIALSILQPIALTFNTYTAFLNGKRDFRSISIYNFLSTIFVVICTGLTLLLTRHIPTLIIVNVGAGALANLLIHFDVLSRFHPGMDHESHAISYGKHLSAMGILGTFSSQIDNLLVFHFLGASELSIFTFAVNIPDRLKGFAKILSNLALPKYAQKTPSELRHALASKLPYLLLSLTFFAIAYALLSPVFYGVFFPQYKDSIRLTQLYSLSLIASASTITVAGLLAERSKKDLYIFTTSASIFQVLSSFACIPFFGLQGAIAARILSLFYNFFLSLILLFHPKRRPVEPTP